MKCLTDNCDKEYIYIFVRKDLTPEQRAVQAAHAVAECGILYVDSDNYSISTPHTIVLIGVKNCQELHKAYESITGLKAILFFEPAIGENTAFAVEPISGEQREMFRGYKTLRYERSFLYYLKVFIRSIKRELFD